MEMMAYVCDKCGKPISKAVRVEVRSYKNSDGFLSRVFIRNLLNFKELDYCEECFKELKRCAGLKSEEGSGDCGTEKGKE